MPPAASAAELQGKPSLPQSEPAEGLGFGAFGGVGGGGGVQKEYRNSLVSGETGVPQRLILRLMRSGSFRKLRVPYLGVLIIRILLFRVLY